MTIHEPFTPRAPGVFLPVPASVSQSAVAVALRTLGFDPGAIRGLTLNVDRYGAGEITAAVEYVDRRDGVARKALAQVTLDIVRDAPKLAPGVTRAP